MFPASLKMAAVAGVVLIGIVLTGHAEAADPVAGKTVFAAQCAICHSAQKGRNMIGPSLFGIVGRKSATGAGFEYSPANQKANMVWDEATLDKYLEAPMTMIPDTTMGYGGLPDGAQRANLIAYLETLK
jgi:cytochrome c